VIQVGSFRPSGRGRGLARYVLLAFPGLLAACGPSEAEQAPAGVTTDEARAVAEAATMLDKQRHADRPDSVASPSPTAVP
jgi:hypothetical protein